MEPPAWPAAGARGAGSSSPKNGISSSGLFIPVNVVIRGGKTSVRGLFRCREPPFCRQTVAIGAGRREDRPTARCCRQSAPEKGKAKAPNISTGFILHGETVSNADTDRAFAVERGLRPSCVHIWTQRPWRKSCAIGWPKKASTSPTARRWRSSPGSSGWTPGTFFQPGSMRQPRRRRKPACGSRGRRRSSASSMSTRRANTISGSWA